MVDARNGDGLRAVGLPEDEERLRRDTDDVVRLHGEFVRRLANQGVHDVAELASLYDRVSRATASIALAEIDLALAQIRAVIDRLRLVGTRLDRLGEIKQRLVGGAPVDRS